MDTRRIIDSLKDNDLISAKKATNDILYDKVEQHLELARESVAGSFAAEGLASGVKKANADDHQKRVAQLKAKHSKEKHTMARQHGDEHYSDQQHAAAYGGKPRTAETNTNQSAERKRLADKHKAEREKLDKQRGGN